MCNDKNVCVHTLFNNNYIIALRYSFLFGTYTHTTTMPINLFSRLSCVIIVSLRNVISIELPIQYRTGTIGTVKQKPFEKIAHPPLGCVVLR